MPLELKDLQTQKSMTVPEEGFTFGREGGDANVLLRDTGVSKRHARVFGENGAWFLEDLGSSNGTWLQKERIKDATELLPGDVFQLSQAKFEVLQVLPGDRDATNAAPKTMNEMPAPEQEDESASASPAPKPSAGSAPKPGPKLPLKDSPSVSKSKPAPAPAPAAKKVDAKSKRGEAPTAIGPESPMPTDPGGGPADSGGSAGAEAKGVGYFLIAVPKAIGFYMAALPVMLVNPVGTIRKGVQEQKHEAKGRMELIAYALPPYLLMAAFGFLGSLIVGIVTHTLSIGSILPIGPLIGAVISSVVVGFVWHPLLNWWVNFLKGTSDDRSRTNYFMLFMTALALTALPTFVATVLSLVHLPLIGLVPLVLRLGASLITLFVSFSWFKAAGVVKWFQIVLLVLGGLACLGTLAGIPAAISGGGGSITVATTGDADAQIAAAQKMAEDAQKQADAAQADAQKQLADATKQVAAATDQAQKDIKKATDQAEKAAEKTGKAVEKATEKVAEKAAEVEKTTAPPPPNPGKAEAPSSPSAGYAAWRTKYDAIEKRVSDDPTVLSKNSAIKDLYRALEEDVSEIESKYQKATKKASEKRLNEHLKDAELFEKTEKRVNELHSKLFH